MTPHNAPVFFTHSYLTPLDAKQWKEGKIYPPLGTLQAAAVIRDEGYPVSFHDMMFSDDPKEIIAPLEKDTPKYFVIFDDHFNFLTKMCLTNMRHAAFEMAKNAKERGCVTIVSSSDATDHYEQYLDNGADFVILGEGEETLKELIHHLETTSEEPAAIHGVAFKRSDGQVHASRRPVMSELDQLPLPAWDLLEISPYRNTWLKKHGYFSLNAYTTRGCPFKCNWCAKPLYGNRYHARSPEHVVRELLWTKELFDYDHIWFCDDILGLKPGWVESFAEEVKKHNLKLSFTMQGRADLLSKERSVKALAEAGCNTVWMGAESGSQKILDAMDKGQKVEHIYKSSRLLRKWKIKPAFFLQFGYPGETLEDIRLTFKMVNDLMPDDIGVSISYPLPGTKFYESVKAELGDKANWNDSDELALMFRNNFSPRFYKRLHRFVHYYFRSIQCRQLFHSLRYNRHSISKDNMRKLMLSPYYILRSKAEHRLLKQMNPEFYVS